ncbi:hypothetical protein HPB50_011238 [Hyalomma asiaticum]|uniref:Uncharacterized protein n=1 Tax=Hyalomma asiaticum TaxID=266040 RepID=A0ACB7RIR1_HYAAI|nr:hypothetical protein HPB50_011238 [Hyalomma asiaticum]
MSKGKKRKNFRFFFFFLYCFRVTLYVAFPRKYAVAPVEDVANVPPVVVVGGGCGVLDILPLSVMPVTDRPGTGQAVTSTGERGRPCQPPGRYSRRKSVFAEHYDPAEDEDDEGAKVVHPKSDEQRERLGEAVKNILLFKSLDVNQMQEVIDAMFERKVKPGEVVIKQGDDGDNFYVIHSGTYHIFVNKDGKQD